MALNASLRRANADLESFAYSVAHDLRSPLRALSGYSEILADDYGKVLDEAGIGYLMKIKDAAIHMGSIIDGLLTLSRVSREQVAFSVVNLSDEAAVIAADMVARNPERDVVVKVKPGMTAVADLDLIRIVLQNLLDNAWKFTSQVTGAVIEVSENDSEFFVRDNGAGFAQEFKDRLFKPFERLHDQSVFPGTGIGLATVQRVISRHNGGVRASSSPGNGATFYFTLNAVRGNE